MIYNLGDKLKSKVIAQRIGVSVSMVGLYESDVRQPSLCFRNLNK